MRRSTGTRGGHRGRVGLAATVVLAVLLLAGCGSRVAILAPATTRATTPGGIADAPLTEQVASAGVQLSDVSVESTVPSFASSILVIDATLATRMINSGSWKPGDPVSLDQLRLISVSYWGFDDKPHTGSLVVNATWATKLCTVFGALYDARFPIHWMELIDVYSADDNRSMAADNSSAYNGRLASGSRAWSMHAYGLAIDLNPVENPYIRNGAVSPVESKAYADRSRAAPGMIEPGDVVVRAFAAIGWKWGGYWRNSKDYQHFSSNGL